MIKSILDELDRIRRELGSMDRRVKVIMGRLHGVSSRIKTPLRDEQFIDWFLNETVLDPDAVTPVEVLFESFSVWTKAHGIQQRDVRWFGRQMRKEKALGRKKRGGGIFYTGIKIETPEERRQRIRDEYSDALADFVK